MKTVYTLLFLFLISNTLSAQTGKITGKIINESSGQILPNATIVLIEKSKTIVADQNGAFIISRLEPGTYSIKCSYTGFKEKIIDEIVVKNDDNTVVNVSLEPKKSLDEVRVVSRVSARKEMVASLLIAQKNMASVSDFISAESIRRTPDRSTSDVLKRVSGASIQDDRFAIIRGLNDRYNAAFINGAPLPSTESDRKAFAFDIFPSSILDNLVIYKTATPDRSGEFAGGIIDITTKSILPKSFTSISIGGSYNSLLTGNTRYFSSNKGNTDFIGIDDGTRKMPAGIPSAKEINALAFSQRAELAKLFSGFNWGIGQRTALPNYNFQIAKGFNIERNKKEFIGALFSLNYNRNFTFSEGTRNSFEFDLTAPLNSQLIQRARYADSVYNDEVVIAGLANIAIKLDNRNTITWKNNLSINTDNKLARRTGPPDFTSDSTLYIRDAVRWYTSNQIFSSQLSGDHLIEKYKTKINWLASYSKVDRDIPNLARTSYAATFPDLGSIYANFSGGPPNQLAGAGTMFFANSNESIQSIKADITQPYRFLKSTENTLKIGGGYQKRERDFTSRVLGFAPYSSGSVNFDFNLFLLPEDQIFQPGNLGKMGNGRGGFMLNDGTLPNSDYTASSALTHAYIMNDQRFFKKLRLIYGVRMESFNQKLNSVKDLNKVVNLDTKLTDYLPSINVVYAVTPKMNLRLSYSETINRPEFRELAPFLFYDFVSNFTYEGQDSLRRAKIKNYDFRYEFFPGKAQVFSVSAFYKDFSDPIEIVTIPNTTGQTIYVNSKSAYVYGVEAEFRTLLSTLVGVKKEGSLLSKFTLAANLAYIKSEVQLGSLFGFPPDLLVESRALQGQSPYIINGSLSYNDDKLGLSSTLSVNRVGDRIMIAGTARDADIYERARTVVDFQVAKFLFKNKLELKLTARDLLSQQIRYYFDFDQSKSYTESDRLFSSAIAPKVFGFNATYKF
jgi:TonB-dependent receptor